MFNLKHLNRRTVEYFMNEDKWITIKRWRCMHVYQFLLWKNIFFFLIGNIVCEFRLEKTVLWRWTEFWICTSCCSSVFVWYAHTYTVIVTRNKIVLFHCQRGFILCSNNFDSGAKVLLNIDDDLLQRLITFIRALSYMSDSKRSDAVSHLFEA